MIDWINVAANALWILGCAVALAGLSYSDWLAGQEQAKLRVVLQYPKMQVVFNLAGTLFSAGLAWTSDTWYEIGLWVLLAAAFLWQMVLSIQAQRNSMG